MAEQAPDPEIESLLKDLQSEYRGRRYEAVRRLDTLKTGSPKVINALKAAAATDKDKFVRQAALEVLNSFGESVGDLNSYDLGALPAKTAKPVRHYSRNEKVIYFAVGFLGWFIVFGLLWGGMVGRQGVDMNDYSDLTSSCALFTANVFVLIVLAFTQRWVALGILSALALNLLVALVVGAGYAGLCFVPFFAVQ